MEQKDPALTAVYGSMSKPCTLIYQINILTYGDWWQCFWYGAKEMVGSVHQRSWGLVGGRGRGTWKEQTRRWGREGGGDNHVPHA